MALANIREIVRLDLPKSASVKGRMLLAELKKIRSLKFRLEMRGIGLMAGLEIRFTDNSPATDVSLQLIKTLLRRGFIFLPEGQHSNVISFTPPLTVSEAQLRRSIRALRDEIERL